MFAKNLVASGFLYSVSYIKAIPTHEKIFAVGKRGPNATFNLFFLGLGWHWVGEFVGFIRIFAGICFPTRQNLVNRERPISCLNGLLISWLIPRVHCATPRGPACSSRGFA